MSGAGGSRSIHNKNKAETAQWRFTTGWEQR
jgi:hypothetical protein